MSVIINFFSVNVLDVIVTLCSYFRRLNQLKYQILAVLTFLSDFGADSHYMASFRGAMYKANLQIPFIEITSRIEPFDIVEAAYLSSMVYLDFSEGSIHVLATNVVGTSFNGHQAAYYNGHYFLAPDNGILSLIFGEHFNDYYLIPTESYEQNIQNVYMQLGTGW